ncbi:Hypothetical protein, predicted lipoprotein [Metamycoplasma auris 15026]|uniref:Uncharacterized protein n=1 Tax=Metamycoplasma auris 15026 TaxID=1188233 RepID=N9TSF0_9BACT|nr:variable surface lipoprotein [Metamycoplasma auris]ENY69084.1 Hypothetical protein, predicted lipoprotein [Metamycoplasma auris 15026]
MKKLNNFLLALGSISSLAALPLIAASCDKTNKNDNTNKAPETDPKNPTNPSNSTTPPADDPSATTQKADGENVKKLKEQTEKLVKDLTEKIAKIKSAKFDNDKLSKLKDDEKNKLGLKNLKDDSTFKKLQEEFTKELEEFIKDLKEDILDKIEKKETIDEEEASDLLEHTKPIPDFVKEQFTIFEKVSK